MVENGKKWCKVVVSGWIIPMFVNGESDNHYVNDFLHQ